MGRDDGKKPTAWPRLNGWISKNANTQSDSNSLNDGISPVSEVVSNLGISSHASSAIAISIISSGPLMILQKIHVDAMIQLRILLF